MGLIDEASHEITVRLHQRPTPSSHAVGVGEQICVVPVDPIQEIAGIFVNGANEFGRISALSLFVQPLQPRENFNRDITLGCFSMFDHLCFGQRGSMQIGGHHLQVPDQCPQIPVVRLDQGVHCRRFERDVFFP